MLQTHKKMFVSQKMIVRPNTTKTTDYHAKQINRRRKHNQRVKDQNLQGLHSINEAQLGGMSLVLF